MIPPGVKAGAKLAAPLQYAFVPIGEAFESTLWTMGVVLEPGVDPLIDGDAVEMTGVPIRRRKELFVNLDQAIVPGK